MSFIASCPFCRRKVKAPERALGQSFACQRCQNHFTLAPDDDAALQVQAQSSSEFEIAIQAAPAPPPPRSAPAAPRAAAADDDPALTETARQVEPLTARVLPILNVPAAPPVDKLGWHTIGVIGLFLGGIALAFASVPGLQWFTIPFAGLGLIAGAFGLMVDYTPKSEEWTPKVGAILCAALLVVAFAWPALLGLDPKVAPLPPPVDPNRQLVQPRGDKGPGGQGAAGPRLSAQPLDKERWVEADLYDVDHGMVRLRIVAAALQEVPVNLRKDRRRAERELALTVKLVHAGTKDPIAFKGWRAAGDPPRLLDGNGQVLAFRPRGDGAAPRSLVPFQPVQETVAFDPPAAAADFVRLELPASAFGGVGAVRFLVPRSMFAK